MMARLHREVLALAGIGLFALALAFCNTARAGGIHIDNHIHMPAEQYETTSGVSDSDLHKVAAMAIAGDQCQHDWATVRLQGCAAIGGFENEAGAAFGLSKRFNDLNMLFSGSILTAFDGQAAYGAGVNWRF